MKNSKAIVGIGLFVIMALVASCNRLDGNKGGKVHDDFPVYHSQAEMERASDLIVEGTVTGSYEKALETEEPSNSNQKPTKEEEFVYTIWKVKVNKVL